MCDVKRDNLLDELSKRRGYEEVNFAKSNSAFANLSTQTGMAGNQGAMGLKQDAAETRETLTGRIRDKMHRAQRESRNADQLRELTYLLDQNPVLARILDLMEEVGLR